ncbi:MAG: type II toxin-antitoxin system VapC family toxin [Cyclobacteriaceae bacterium]|nr:type II toxin-antitoxin system VapC family toxin [Cyclobacteriaceae bacterium]
MADKNLMVDTTILIDYFRKTDKSKSRLFQHHRLFDQLFISTITEFEILNGATARQLDFWEKLLPRFIVLEFDSRAARESTRIVQQLKSVRKNIDKPDLFIAATAIVHGLSLDTLNRKHFIHIENLELLEQ